MDRIEGVLNYIPKPKVQNLVKAVYTKHKKKFLKEPAACGNHHAYDGGLYVHSCSTAVLAGKICNNYLDMEIDVSVCVAGAFLHDIGKVDCYEKKNGKTISTIESRLFHHIPIGFHIVKTVYNEMEKELRPTKDDLYQVLHIIISHHGKRKYSSPREPKTNEAIIVSEADFLDAYLNAPEDQRGIYRK